MGTPHACTSAIAIRPATANDWPAIWALLEPVFREGCTYAVDRDVDEDTARRLWMDPDKTVWVALAADASVIGTAYVRANQAGGGRHVCNAGYVVAQSARGQGVASALCRHSQVQAVQMGFRAMQFNLVVSTNSTAVRLWQREGFSIVGTLPGAFVHPLHGEVDAHVMFKRLVPPQRSPE